MTDTFPRLRLRREGLQADPGAGGQVLAAAGGMGVAVALGWRWA